MQMPHQTPATGGQHQLPHRMKTPFASGNTAAPAPYPHHFLDRNSSANSSTNSLLFNPPATYTENAAVPTHASVKRPRSHYNINSSFLSPFVGYPSPPPFEPDRPLPDFSANWGFNSRSISRSNSSSASNAPVPIGNVGSFNATSLAGIGSPNGASMFADSFLPDYDSTLYSLWNTPGGGSVMGYETENDAAQSQQQQVQPPLYMPSDIELKMDYPQLPEFNEDLDSYLNDTVESAGPSPTTPLGISTTNSTKMDRLVTADSRTDSRKSQLEKLLAPSTIAEYPMERNRTISGVENGSGHLTKRACADYKDAYAAIPVTSGVVGEAAPSTSSFQTLSRSASMEAKQRAVMMPLGTYQSGQASTPATISQGETSSGTVSSTAKVALTSTVPDTPSSKAGKRPRSRQCEFPGCQNRARSHQKCKKHGGAHQCVFEGCTKNSQSRGLCIAHGGGSRCKKEGCVRAAQSKGLCKSHGGGEYCAVEGCNKKAHLKHLCRTHGGGVRCKFEKCSKWAQRKGWCMAHAKEFAAS